LNNGFSFATPLRYAGCLNQIGSLKNSRRRVCGFAMHRLAMFNERCVATSYPYC